MEKRWSKTEIAHLKRQAPTKSVEELAQRLHTDAETVRRKLSELGLGGSSSPAGGKDPVLVLFEEALESVHAKQWETAADLLRRVIQDGDVQHLTDRARQYLAICEQHTREHAVDDPFLEAVMEKNRGNYARALELCQKHGEREDERYAYLLASLRALSGDRKQALELLTAAVRLEPKNRVHAYHDPDFQSLRGEEEFVRLLGAR